MTVIFQSRCCRFIKSIPFDKNERRAFAIRSPFTGMSVFLRLLILMKLALKRFSVRKTDSNVKQKSPLLQAKVWDGLATGDVSNGDVHEIIT
jgi:hypothetical protein